MIRRATAAIRTAIAQFRKSERGNVAIMFGFVAVPLIVAMGGVVDYTRVYYAHTSMQDALDATALGLSKSAPKVSPGQLVKQAQDYFAANFHDVDVEALQVSPTYNTTASTLTVAGNANVRMHFLGLIGLNVIPVQASSTVVWGETRLRVSLVLDNTGSMAQAGKMTALKAAAHSLLSQLQTFAAKAGDVYVSIVPFSRDVTVNKASIPASCNTSPPGPSCWLRWDLWDAANGTCSNTTYKNQAACTKANKIWTAADHKTWNGCITDRDQNYDTVNAAPSKALPATLFPTDQYSSCPTMMMGLTYDWAALNGRVDMMQPNGLTNQSIGLQWGWQTLTQAPFSVPAKEPGVEYRDVIIILSDGLNTQNRWTSSAKVIDDREKILCTNAKQSGIDIFTVQVNTDNDPMSVLLQNCATDPSQFFLLTSADQIVKTFEQIATSLTQIRISS
jgi:Flp pilus assembly protein TadG